MWAASFFAGSSWVPTAVRWPACTACSRSALQWLTCVRKSSPRCPPGGSSTGPTSWCHCSSLCTTCRTSWTPWPARWTSGASPSSSTVPARWGLQPWQGSGRGPWDAFPVSEGGMSCGGRVATAHYPWCFQTCDYHRKPRVIPRTAVLCSPVHLKSCCFVLLWLVCFPASLSLGAQFPLHWVTGPLLSLPGAADA